MNKVTLTFLGTGTSQGVPIIGCGCPVCRSADPRDQRLRSSALVRYGRLVLLIDAGPDFRFQMLRAGVSHLDAILLTHNHKDHTGGLDDVRALNYIDRRPIEIYCEERVLSSLKLEYAYCFTPKKYPGTPEWHIRLIENRPFLVQENRTEGKLIWVHDRGYFHEQPDGTLLPAVSEPIDKAVEVSDPQFGGLLRSEVPYGLEVIPIRGFHDEMPVLGFRFGNIAYLTDMSRLPEEEMKKLQGLKHLTLNTVGYKKHHSHFSLDEALDLADRIGAERTWLTHLSHAFPVHEEFAAQLHALCRARRLRSEVQPAWDGLTLESAE